MKTLFTYPPNYEQIKKVFNPPSNVVFTYGDTLYSPGTTYIPRHLEVHEETHAEQQTDPVAWWDEYIKNPTFRFNQELEAYKNQYQYYKRTNSEHPIKVRRFLYSLVSDLCGSIYGNCCSYEQAFKALSGEEKAPTVNLNREQKRKLMRNLKKKGIHAQI